MSQNNVIFNVGGTKFEISKGLLQKYPNSKLSTLSQKASSEIFIDHNPLAFGVILDYLRSNKLLVPKYVAKEVVELQLKEFNIPYDQIIEPDVMDKDDNLPSYESAISGFTAPYRDEKNYSLKETVISTDVILPYLKRHAKRGHRQVTFYLTPCIVTPKNITTDLTDPHEWIHLQHSSQSQSTRYLNSSHSVEKSGVKKVVAKQTEVCCRTENEFGLLSSKSLEIIQVDVFNPNNLRNKDGKTPLMVAACENCPDVINYLVGLPNVNIDLQNNDGESALYQAASLGNVEVVKIMMNANANVESCNRENITPLIIAAYNGHADVCSELIDHGHANVDFQDSSYKTALLLASYEGHVETAKVLLARGAKMCRLLLEHNADRSVTADNGKTAGIPSQRVSGRFPTTTPQQPIEQNVMMQNVYPEIPINNTKGYMMPKRIDSRRKRIQRKNTDLVNAQYRHNITGSDNINDGKYKTAPHLKNDMAPRESKTPWVLFSLAVTACFCNPCLSTIGKMKDSNVRQAWREKVALVVIILLISFFMGFLAFGLTTIACGTKKQTFFKEDVFEKYGPNQPGQKVHIIHGRLYNTGEYILFGSHRPLTPPIEDKDLEPIIFPTFGQDISDYFPLDNQELGCPFAPKNGGPICDRAIETKNPLLYCHTSSNGVNNALKELYMSISVSYSWQNITKANTTLFVYNNKVYDLGNYLDPSNEDKWLGDDSVTEWLRGLLGKDATRDILRTTRGQEISKCLPNFKVGDIEGTTIGCFANKLILIIMLVVFTGISLIKFISAIAFDWFLSWQLGKISKKPKTDDTTSHILLLVTCYSEGEHSMRTTLDSLASSDYSDKHKLLMVIADGDITGSDNDKSTPTICKDLIEPFNLSSFESPIPQSYLAIGDGKKQHNMAEVIIGYYNCKGHRVPMCLINKVGTPEERKGLKAGNRGKRDSQLILMKWLSNVFFNDRMTPLDFELFEKVRTLTGVTPDKYEMILMVDADTLVMKDSVSRMVAAMERDPTVMGLCGETKIANKKTSWVTMIQVFEYYISHHLGKSFESIFGGVTCLPGCFCMYRIKAPKCNGFSVPILANPDIVELYSSNTVETLHQKNLLLLGEDRYLTTLMLRTFPKRKMIYVPKAICKTIVPDEFKVLLSQRRRWINSTIHNLMELILVPQLCGIFCCSMQFVIFLELVGTVVLPSSLIFMIYLFIVGGLGVDITLPLIFIAATFLLQAFLVIFTTHKFIYVMWMFIFISAMPIWNFILPVYAFWHFDDFSWGATRKISGEDNGHEGNKTDVFERNQIPRKTWHEWKLDNDNVNVENGYPSKIQQTTTLQNRPPSQRVFPGGFAPIPTATTLPPPPPKPTSIYDNNFNNRSSHSVTGTRPMGPRGPINLAGSRKS
ncbi:7192_t:CDS:2 [Funneliformis mosseae]|uniref:chitin synthase n=1 Tax=Funneliformis mosseae TaxID=27381 RepID=A0A9N8VQZ8_FUNMO|nr:7192_t:CDS:2 [Funneliformis mosseae]